MVSILGNNVWRRRIGGSFTLLTDIYLYFDDTSANNYALTEISRTLSPKNGINHTLFVRPTSNLKSIHNLQNLYYFLSGKDIFRDIYYNLRLN